MSVQNVFQISLVLGYVAWFLCFRTYILPWLSARDRFDGHRAIATLHSFRFFGLAFIVPGVAGYHLPPDFSFFAAYVDLATGVLALLALLSAKIRPLFWFFVVAFNLVGLFDLLVDTYHAMANGVPAVAGELGVTYGIVIIAVPLLVITSVWALYSLARPKPAGV